MKKFLASAIVLFCASRLSAFDLPLDKDGALAEWIQDVGVEVYYSTGSRAPYLVTGGTTTFLSGLSGGMGSRGSTIAVFGVLTSTPQGISYAAARSQANRSYVFLRATDTANTSSELLVPPISHGLWLSSAPVGEVAVGDPANHLVIFDPPVLAMDNLSVNSSSDPSGVQTSVNFNFAVFYRHLSTNVAENTWIPIDDYQGAKVHDASFYGVRPSTNSLAGGGSGDGLGTEGWDFTTAERVMNSESTDTANINNRSAAMFYYGFSASSGAAAVFFVCDSTGSALGTQARDLFPAIYPRTLNRSFFDAQTSIQFNFPWPIKVPDGVTCQSSSADDRFRHYVRNRKALR